MQKVQHAIFVNFVLWYSVVAQAQLLVEVNRCQLIALDSAVGTPKRSTDRRPEANGREVVCRHVRRRHAPVRRRLRRRLPVLIADDLGHWHRFQEPIRIKDLLSDEVTVKRAAVKTYQTIRQVLIAELQAHFQDRMDAGCTLDIWTEPLTSIAYMSVTMHYIDAAFKHYTRTLQVDQFPEVSHTAVAILKTFK